MQLKQGSQPQDKKTTLVQYMELIIKIQTTVPLTSNMGQVVVVPMLQVEAVLSFKQEASRSRVAFTLVELQLLK